MKHLYEYRLNPARVRPQIFFLFLMLLISFGAIAQDLSVSIATPPTPGSTGSPQSYTVTLMNTGASAVTGIVQVTNTFNPPNGVAVTVGTPTASSGTYASGVWSVNGLAANASVTLIIPVTPNAGGVFYLTSEITQGGTPTDPDSTPNNGATAGLGEDDIDRKCFSVPIRICAGESYTASVPAGYTNIQWTKDGVTVVGSGSSLNITASGSYTFTAMSGTCAVDGCCPIIVQILPPPAVIASNNGPVCVGGTLMLNATAGMGAYSWAGSQSFTSTLQNPTIGSMTANKAGLYSLTVTGAGTNTCTASTTTSVAVENLSATATATPSAICTNGTVTLNATPSGATYAWSNSAGSTLNSSSIQSPTATGFATAGNYSFTVTVGSGACAATSSVQVVVSPAPTVVANNNGPLCEGQTLNLTATGGSSYAWLGPNGFGSNSQYPSITNADIAHTGAYSVTVTGAGGCTAQAITFVQVNAKPTALANSNSPVCNNGTINLNASGGGGIGPVTYAWTGPNSYTSAVQSPTISPATVSNVGTYLVTVTQNNCTNTATTSVTVNVGVAGASSNSPVCEGGTIQLNATSGTSYNWAGPGFSSLLQNPTINNAVASNAGVYSVTVNGSSGCTGTATVSVSVLSKPIIIANSNSPVCAGGVLSLTASGATSYNWVGPNAFGSNAATPILVNVSAVHSGNYSVTGTDGSGCTNSVVTPVIINPIPNISIGSNSPVCATGTIQLNSSGGGSYSWTGPNGFSNTTANPSITNATTASQGQYQLTVTNNGCTASAITSVSVVVGQAVASYSGAVCIGGAINLIANTGGTNYVWAGSNGFASSSSNSNIVLTTSASLSDAGTYTVTVSGTSGCTGTSSVQVVVHTNPTPLAGNTGPVCAGGSLTLMASGGVGYVWSGPSFFGASGSSVSIPNIQSNQAGTYTVVVIDANNCKATSNTAVLVNPSPVPTINNNGPLCVGNSLNLLATGGTSYSWTGPNSFTASIANPSKANIQLADVGTYIVTITNNACTATASTFVTVTQGTATATSNGPICPGTTLQLGSSNGGSSYQWQGPAGSGFSASVQNPTVSNVTTANSGIYSVTVNGTSGCTGTATVSVIIYPTPVITAGNNGPLCQNATINLTATGGISYAWTGPNNFGSNVQNPSFVASATSITGQYTVRVTDGNGCTGQAATFVQVNVAPTPNVANSGPICANATLLLSATGGTNYAWAGPGAPAFSSTLQSPSISNITTAQAGAYTVTVTSNGCTASATTLVVVNSNPILVVPIPAPICENSFFQLSASGASSYQWAGPNSFGSNSQNPAHIFASLAMDGTYSVSASANGGCSTSATVSVQVKPKPSLQAVGSVVCAGETIQLNATSTNPAGTYEWLGPQGYRVTTQSPSISNASTNNIGVYSVTVTSNGCTNSATATVAVSTSGVNIAYTPVCAGQTLTLQATVGGTSYAWARAKGGFSSAFNAPQIGNAQPGIDDGVYTVTVTGPNTSCTGTATVSVIIFANPTPTASSTSPICAGSTISLNSSAGFAGYSWKGPNAFGDNVQNPSQTNVTVSMTGIYSVTVTDVQGCKGSATASVLVNANPTTTASVNTPVCVGQSATFASSSGTGYTWAWAGTGLVSNLQNPTISSVGLANNSVYSVTVTQNNCTATATTQLVVNAIPVPNATVNSPVCAGSQINLAVTGGTTYLWNGPNNFASVAANPSHVVASTTMAGIYSVTAYNGSCTATSQVSVVVNQQPQITANGSNVCAGTTATLNVNVSNPSGVPTYTWQGPAALTNSSTASPSIPNAQMGATGIYTVTVTQNGCSSSVTTSVYVSQTGVVALSTGPVCVGGSIQLLATQGASTYTWAGPNGFSQTAITPTISNVTMATAGIYTVTALGGSLNCTGTATVQVIINTPPTPTASSNGPICAGATLNLNASAGYVGYTWAGPNAFGANAQSLSLNGTTIYASGNYSVTVRDNNQCTASAVTTVVVNANPVVNIVSSNGTVCAGNTISLNVNATTSGPSAVTYLWDGPTFVSNVQNPSIPNAAVSNTGTYTVTVSQNNCSATGTTTVSVFQQPITVSTNAPICEGQTLQLFANGSGGFTVYDWMGPAFGSGMRSSVQNPSFANATSALNGIYSVTVVGQTGCTASAMVTVVVKVNPTTTIASNHPVCQGFPINLTANVSTPTSAMPNTYNWTASSGSFVSNSSSPTVLNNLSTGTYNVSLSVTNNGCSASVSTTVYVKPLPTIVVNVPTSICSGTPINLSSTLNSPYPASTPYYDWTASGGEFTGSNTASPTIGSTTNPGPYSYSVTVTQNSCTASATASVTVKAVPTVSITPPPAICFGQSLTLTTSASSVYGGAFNYNWLVSPGGGTFNTSIPASPVVGTNMPVGTHNFALTITNNGCTATANTSVQIKPNPDISINPNNPICQGEALNLSASANPSAGTTFQWAGSAGAVFTNTGTATPTVAANTPAGYYTFTVTATNSSCTSTASTTLQVKALPVVTAQPMQAVCVGGLPVNLTASATNPNGGAVSYNWTPSGSVATFANSNTANPTVMAATPAGTYTYTVVVTNSSCTASASTSLSVKVQPTLALSSNGPLCAGQTLTLSANATNTTTFGWAGSNGFTSSGTQTSVSVTGLAVGSHTFTVSAINSNGCTTTAVISATVNANPSASIIASPATPCEGTTFTLNGFGGTSYQWAGPIGFTSNQALARIDYAGTPHNGIYTVTAFNNFGCSATATQTISVKELSNLSVNVTPVCEGGTIQFNVVPDPTHSQFQWKGPMSFSSTYQNPAVPNVRIAEAGVYSVTMSNLDNCSTSLTVPVSVKTKPNMIANAGTACINSNTILTASGASYYAWQGPAGFSSNLQNPALVNLTSANAGAYSVTGTIQYNIGPGQNISCEASTTVNLVVASTGASANALSPICEGGTIQLNTTSGSTYSWAGPVAFTNNTQSPSRLNATPNMSGIYSVTVGGSGGCTGTATVSVLVNAKPTATASNNGAANVICVGKKLTLTATGGGSYQWTGPNSFVANTAVVSIDNAGLANAGVYQVLVMNTENCTNTATTSVSLSICCDVTVSASANPICKGEELRLTASGNFFSVQWAGPRGFTASISNPTIPNADTDRSGVYTVTAYSSVANTCSTTATVSVNVGNLPLSAASNGTVMNNGTIYLTASSTATSFAWTGPNGFSSTVQNPTRNNADASMSGTYTVSASNTNSCSATATTQVVICNVAVLATASHTCVGTTIMLSASGTNVAYYSWTGPDGFSSNNQYTNRPQATDAMAGIYTVTVIAAGNSTCTASTTTSVSLKPKPNAGAASNGTVQQGNTIQLLATGGGTYAWAGPVGFSSTQQNPQRELANTDMSGIYTVTVTNTEGCTATATTSVIITGCTLTVTASANGSNLTVGNTLSLSASAGSTYSWLGPDGFTSTVRNPTRTNITSAMAGIYSVTVSNASGCFGTATVAVSEISELIRKFGSIGDFVWKDTNANGIQDDGTTGVANVTVELYRVDDDGYTIGGPIQTKITTTSGYYLFENLTSDTYKVRFVLASIPVDCRLTDSDKGGDDERDSDADNNGYSPEIVIDVTGVGKEVNNYSIDAGLVTANDGSIGDLVWKDTNKNGIQDNGEKGVPNITVELYRLDSQGYLLGAPIQTKVTDSNGLYLFNRLPSGDYKVKFVLATVPVECKPTDPDQGGNDDKDSDAGTDGFSPKVTINVPRGGKDRDNLSIDLGLVPNFGSIGDLVWKDRNGNGIQDYAEKGVPNIEVELFKTDAAGFTIGAPFKKTKTNTNGLYLFDSLASGTYKVRFVTASIPKECSLTLSDRGGNDDKDSDAGTDGFTPMVTINTNGTGKDRNNLSIDAGLLPQYGSIGDYTWLDVNKDGKQTAGESPLKNVWVYLYDCKTNLKIDSMKTDNLGKYLFDSLDSGQYKVLFVAPQDTELTLDNQGGDDKLDSDAGNDGFTHKINIDVTKATTDTLRNNLQIDAGFVIAYGSIGDMVWKDLNANGVQDLNEPGVQFIKVQLLSNTNAVLDETTTDQNGYYKFENLLSGNYRVKFTNIPAECKITTPNVGTDDKADSDADKNGLTHLIRIDTRKPMNDTLRNNLNIDAGLVPPFGSIGNYVWKDTNQNGIQETGEVGVKGIKVELYRYEAMGQGIGDTLIRTTTTSDNGSYLFDKLLSGNYRVRFVPSSIPADCKLSDPDQGTSDDLDSDADPLTGFTPPIGINAAGTGKSKDNMSIDAGLRSLCAKPNAGKDITLCLPATTIQLMAAQTGQTWLSAANNPAGVTINDRGEARGMTQEIAYTFVLKNLNTGNIVCTDSVVVTRAASPAFQASVYYVTCDPQGKPIANGRIILSGFTQGTRADISMGATYTGTKNYDTATEIPADGLITQTLPNPLYDAAQPYTVRVWNSNGCYTDRTVSLIRIDCACMVPKCVPFYLHRTK